MSKFTCTWSLLCKCNTQLWGLGLPNSLTIPILLCYVYIVLCFIVPYKPIIKETSSTFYTFVALFIALWPLNRNKPLRIETNTSSSLSAHVFLISACGQNHIEISGRSLSISPRSGSSFFFCVWWKGTMVTGPMRRSCLEVAASYWPPVCLFGLPKSHLQSWSSAI